MSDNQDSDNDDSLVRSGSRSLAKGTSQLVRRGLESLDALDLAGGQPETSRPFWTFVNEPGCGAVRFDNDQRSTLFGGVGVPATHALGHVLLRTIAKPGYITPDATRQTFETGEVFRTIELWASIRNGVWSNGKEEEFAQQFEIYAAEWNPALKLNMKVVHLSPLLRKAFQVLCPVEKGK